MVFSVPALSSPVQHCAPGALLSSLHLHPQRPSLSGPCLHSSPLLHLSQEPCLALPGASGGHCSHTYPAWSPPCGLGVRKASPSSGSIAGSSANQASFPEETAGLPKATKPESSTFSASAFPEPTGNVVSRRAGQSQGHWGLRGVRPMTFRMEGALNSTQTISHPPDEETEAQVRWQVRATTPHVQLLLPEAVQGHHPPGGNPHPPGGNPPPPGGNPPTRRVGFSASWGKSGGRRPTWVQPSPLRPS